MTPIEQLAHQTRRAASIVATLSTDVKNAVLLDLAARIDATTEQIKQANAADLVAATAPPLTKGSPGGYSDAKLKRLTLTDSAIHQMAEGLRQVVALPDPVGQITRETSTPAGLLVRRVRCPIGVIMMIYEARPNVTIDAFALCFKAGNACILKGGREATHSNRLLADFAEAALEANGITKHALALLTTSDREEIKQLLTLEQYIDLVIPRGGTELIRFVHEHSRIPTVQHFQGVCHIFVDASADLDQAVNVCATAKTSAPATCNAAECILVHETIADTFLPKLAARLAKDGVEIHADESVCRILGDRAAAPSGTPPVKGGQGGGVVQASPAPPLAPALPTPQILPATQEDWGKEYLDLILAIRVVPDLTAAIAHIHRYGSNHTDAILSTDPANQQRFLNQVHSSCTLVNASTRFNDGFQLGLGAEIGISTSKVHAFGPMGLEELTTQRFVVHGAYQIR